MTGNIQHVAMKIQALGFYCHLKGQENYNGMADSSIAIDWRQDGRLHLLHAPNRKTSDTESGGTSVAIQRAALVRKGSPNLETNSSPKIKLTIDNVFRES